MDAGAADRKMARLQAEQQLSTLLQTEAVTFRDVLQMCHLWSDMPLTCQPMVAARVLLLSALVAFEARDPRLRLLALDLPGVRKRESERAMRDSDEGKIQAAVNKLMQPFQPNKREDEVVDREVIHTIRQRVEGWGQHATIITGRYGSGKSVALQEALKNA